MKSFLWFAAVLSVCITSTAFAQDGNLALPTMTKRPFSVEDLFAFQRVAAPSVSPDGAWAVFAATEITDSHTNKSVSRLWLVPTDGSAPARQLTNSAAKDNNPKWSPDGRWIAFESTRSGTSQLWLINPCGGEAKQLTKISTDASNAIWSCQRFIRNSLKSHLPKVTRRTRKNRMPSPRHP